MYWVPTPGPITSYVMLACLLISSTAIEALECVTQKQAVCRDDVCQFSSSEDEPLSFSFSSKDRTITVAFGEGSQSGPLTLVESGEAIAVVSLLGPVQQGGKSLGGRNELFVAQIDKKTKNFFVKRSAEMLKGTCE